MSANISNPYRSLSAVRRILVIEDELPLLKIVQAKLQRANFSVLTARSVDQAMAALQAKKIVDAIWLDHYLLGQQTGLDFVSNIKKQGSVWRSVPIYVVTNTAGSETEDQYISAGVDRIYNKAATRLDEIVGDIAKRISG